MDRKHTSQGLYIAAGLLSGACCAVMVVFPEMAIASAKKGILLWGNAVVPALLPFFICANFLIALGAPALIGGLFEQPFRRLFRAPGSSAFVFLISITSGYPMGPKLIGDLCRRGEISSGDAKRMLTFCSTSGPLFLLGTVGVSMLGSPEMGMIIALAHYGGALLNGWITGLFHPYKGGGKGLKIKSPASGETIMEMLTTSIFSALKTLGLIAGYLVLFTIAADFLELTGILQRFPGNFGKGLLSGIMEVTVGCSYVSGSGLPPALLCTLCAFLISFGGLSVMAQSMSVLTGSGISPLYYLKTKLMHGILASLIAWFTAPHILQAAASAGAFGESTSSAAMVPQQWLFSSQLLILVLILLGVSILLGKIKTP